MLMIIEGLKMNVKTDTEAKIKASIYFNSRKLQINSFDLISENGTYKYLRNNKISANGKIKYGKWF